MSEFLLGQRNSNSVFYVSLHRKQVKSRLNRANLSSSRHARQRHSYSERGFIQFETGVKAASFILKTLGLCFTENEGIELSLLLIEFRPSLNWAFVPAARMSAYELVRYLDSLPDLTLPLVYIVR